MTNLIIVESENDKFFIESLLEKLNLENIEVGIPICKIDDFDCLGGLNKLKHRLKALKFDRYDNIGIILDADEDGITKRVEFINSALKDCCSDITLTEINKFEKSEELDLNVGCYITNVDGKGELETVMRKIKSKSSPYADCLSEWRDCLLLIGIEVKEKEFDKIWVSNYLRYDTCLGDDTRQKSRKCKNQLIHNSANTQKIENNLKSNSRTIKKDIWNFDDSILSELKIFLKLFT